MENRPGRHHVNRPPPLMLPTIPVHYNCVQPRNHLAAWWPLSDHFKIPGCSHGDLLVSIFDHFGTTFGLLGGRLETTYWLLPNHINGCLVNTSWPIWDHLGPLVDHSRITRWLLVDQSMSWWPLVDNFDQLLGAWWPLWDQLVAPSDHCEIQGWSLGDYLLITFVVKLVTTILDK